MWRVFADVKILDFKKEILQSLLEIVWIAIIFSVCAYKLGFRLSFLKLGNLSVAAVRKNAHCFVNLAMTQMQTWYVSQGKFKGDR